MGSVCFYGRVGALLCASCMGIHIYVHTAYQSISFWVHTQVALTSLSMLIRTATCLQNGVCFDVYVDVCVC